MSPQPNGEPLSPESSTQSISSPTSWQRRESCRFREIEEVHGRAPYFRFAETNEKHQSLLKMDLLLARRLPLHDPRLTLVPMALGGAATPIPLLVVTPLLALQSRCSFYVFLALV